MDVILIQLRNLTAQFAQREVGHTDTGERVHGGACALDERAGLQGIGREGRVVDAEAAYRSVPRKNAQRMLRGARWKGLQWVIINDN
jgi:hypothetical protein